METGERVNPCVCGSDFIEKKEVITTRTDGSQSREYSEICIFCGNMLYCSIKPYHNKIINKEFLINNNKKGCV